LYIYFKPCSFDGATIHLLGIVETFAWNLFDWVPCGSGIAWFKDSFLSFCRIVSPEQWWIVTFIHTETMKGMCRLLGSNETSHTGVEYHTFVSHHHNGKAIKGWILFCQQCRWSEEAILTVFIRM
jgi:hypothetical protein